MTYLRYMLGLGLGSGKGEVIRQSFKGGMGRTLGGSDAGLAVLGVLVGERELAQVPPDHVELDLDHVEGLAVVHGHIAAHHLGQNNRIPEVGFDCCGFLTRLRVLLGLLALEV